MWDENKSALFKCFAKALCHQAENKVSENFILSVSEKFPILIIYH